MEKEDIFDCEEVREKLPHYLVDELSVDDAIKIGEHLLQCKSCRDFLEELENVKEVLQEPLPRPSESLKEEIKRRIQAEKKKRKSKKMLWLSRSYPLYRVAITALLSFLLGVSATWLFFSPRPSSRSPSDPWESENGHPWQPVTSTALQLPHR